MPPNAFTLSLSSCLYIHHRITVTMTSSMLLFTLQKSGWSGDESVDRITFIFSPIWCSLVDFGPTPKAHCKSFYKPEVCVRTFGRLRHMVTDITDSFFTLFQTQRSVSVQVRNGCCTFTTPPMHHVMVTPQYKIQTLQCRLPL